MTNIADRPLWLGRKAGTGRTTRLLEAVAVAAAAADGDGGKRVVIVVIMASEAAALAAQRLYDHMHGGVPSMSMCTMVRCATIYWKSMANRDWSWEAGRFKGMPLDTQYLIDPECIEKKYPYILKQWCRFDAN